MLDRIHVNKRSDRSLIVLHECNNNNDNNNDRCRFQGCLEKEMRDDAIKASPR